MSKKLILVLNCGSSSLKFCIINAISGTKHIFGIAECLNMPEARIIYMKKEDHKKIIYKLDNSYNHNKTLSFILNKILLKKPELLTKLTAIGHRIVHGGKKFTKSIIINDEVIKEIKNAISFAPLHNPANLIGINESFKQFPKFKKKNVAVFDTAFHQTMPEESYLYALPYYLYKKHSIRRYGAHGISHMYVRNEASKILNKPIDKLNIITCHLGNGCSVAAINKGKCVDTSMGLTPLEGLIMGTRSGDIDPSIIFYLHDILGFSISKINNLLTKKSGFLGLTEITSDCRYIEKKYFNNIKAHLAMNMYCRRLAKYIGAYSTLMNGKLDAIIFTGGIGENSIMVRELTLNKLSLLNFKINKKINKLKCIKKFLIITKKNSCPAIVIPTNEELIIAKETSDLIK